MVVETLASYVPRLQNPKRRAASLPSLPAALLKTLASPFAGHFVIVVKLQLVYLEAVDCPHLRRGGGALEPRRRTPRILIGHRYQPMLHRILMHVIESRPV